VSTPPSTPRPRIQGLSDLVFGLALSISALTLIGQQPTTTEQFGFSLGLYGFSFIILIGVWQMYSTVTSILPAETSILVDLNVILLFLVSIEPYLFNELFVAKGGLSVPVSAVYSVDLAAMFFILAFFLNSLANEDKHLVPKVLVSKYKLRRNMVLLVALTFTISIHPYFGDTVVATFMGGAYDVTLRSVLWLIALFLSWGRRLIETFPAR
jgi:uncharacterized membrane protein